MTTTSTTAATSTAAVPDGGLMDEVTERRGHDEFRHASDDQTYVGARADGGADVTNDNRVDDRTQDRDSDDHSEQVRSQQQRKRTERQHALENMFSLSQIVSRDLRITGVSKKGSSWRYHIEVLDIRVSLTPFTNSRTLQEDPVHPQLPPVVRYSVMRRYNDFRQLYLYLLDTLPLDLLETLPKFPDGGIFSYFRGDDPKLLQYRKEQLQKFLRALDESEDTKWNRAFIHFLCPDIQELTTIGGTFASQLESSVVSSTSSSSMASISRIDTTAGYVSLSCVKSPEIRFKKQPSDGRGDWKRRKIARANRGEDATDLPLAKRKLVEDLRPEHDDASLTDDDDENEDGNDGERRKPCTELMKLLSLDGEQP